MPSGPEQDEGMEHKTQENISTTGTEKAPKNILQQVRVFFGGDKLDMQKLKALGLGAVASYGCVSNVTYGTGLAISWISFVRQTGETCILEAWLL